MEDYFIVETKNSIPSVLCNEIILMFELENTRYDGLTLGGVQKSIKNTTDLLIPKNDIKWNKIEKFLYKELSLNLSAYIKRLNNINTENCDIIDKKDIFINNTELLTTNSFMVQKYDSGIGKYLYHNDYAVNYNEKSHRVLTFLWYLNDVTIGGETEFFNGKVVITPETGKLLLFPASWLYPHRGKIPFSSDKYIITGWLYIGH
jgi:hypothetical protein